MRLVNLSSNLCRLTFRINAGIIYPIQAGRVIAALVQAFRGLHRRVEESPHSIELGAG